MKKALFILDAYERIYGKALATQIGRKVEIYDNPVTPNQALENKEMLAELQILFTGWGAPALTQEFLEAAPKLELVLYGAGTIRGVVTDEFWAKNIPICSAWRANAVPVAEMTAAQIVLALKKAYTFTTMYRETKKLANAQGFNVPGLYTGVVGLVSLGAIGRLVAERLRTIGVSVVAYDPYASNTDAAALGVTLVSLEELFAQSDVVSLHTPWLPETEGMIDCKLLSAMKQDATLVNTSRGAIVNENDLIAVWNDRPDLLALLDVTWPEPPAEDSPLWSLPNVVLTPHIAGSTGHEARRHGFFMLEECDRYLKGEPLKHRVTPDMAQTMA